MLNVPLSVAQRPFVCCLTSLCLLLNVPLSVAQRPFVCCLTSLCVLLNVPLCIAQCPFVYCSMSLCCSTSQQRAGVSQGRICSDMCTCCHTDTEVADQTFHLTQSQYADTWPASPRADPISPEKFGVSGNRTPGVLTRRTLNHYAKGGGPLTTGPKSRLAGQRPECQFGKALVGPDLGSNPGSPVPAADASVLGHGGG